MLERESGGRHLKPSEWGIDADGRPLQAIVLGQTLQKDRDDAEFLGLFADRFLPQHQAAGRGEGGDQMQRRLPGSTIMAAPQGLSVDRHRVLQPWPAGAHPAVKQVANSAGLIRFIMIVSQLPPGTPKWKGGIFRRNSRCTSPQSAMAS